MPGRWILVRIEASNRGRIGGFVEDSTTKSLARRPGLEPSEQLVFGFRLATAREPGESELSLLAGAHQKFTARFQDDVSAAKKLLSVGEKPRDQSLDPIKLSAMTMVASLLLNLDETVTKE